RGRAGRPAACPVRPASAAIGGLHDAGTATGADDEAPLLAPELLRPGRQPLGKLARGLVIGREPQRHLRRLDALPCPLSLGQRRPRRLLRAQPRRPHEDDGVLDSMALEAIERLQVFCEDAQSARILAPQEAGVLIGFGLAMRAPTGFVQSAPRFYPVF